MPRLIWVFAGRTLTSLVFVTGRLEYACKFAAVYACIILLIRDNFKWTMNALQGAEGQNQQNNLYSQGRHRSTCSLARVFDVRPKKVWVLRYLLSFTAKTLIRLDRCRSHHWVHRSFLSLWWCTIQKQKDEHKKHFWYFWEKCLKKHGKNPVKWCKKSW